MEKDERKELLDWLKDYKEYKTLRNLKWELFEKLPNPPVTFYGESAIRLSLQQPKWRVPYAIQNKVLVEGATTGAFYRRDENPKQPYKPEETRDATMACIEAGATAVHLHVRDVNTGMPSYEVEEYEKIVNPIRDKYGSKVFIDGCCVYGPTFEETMLPVKYQKFEMTPINATAVYCGEMLLAIPPQYLIMQTLYCEKYGVKPMIALYDTGDIDNARRWLIEPGIAKKPIYWNVLPSIPGCSPMPNAKAMCESMLFFLNRILEMDPDPMILVSVAGRASSFFAALSVILGCHIRVGTEDTTYKYPHRDDPLEEASWAVGNAVDLVHDLGLEVASADDLRKAIGIEYPPKKVK